jgi:hypothetical protein
MALDEELLYNASKQLFKTSVTANLSPRKQEDVNGLGQLITINRKLTNMPQNDARQYYLELDEGVQEILKKWNPEAPFANDPDLGPLGVLKEKIVRPIARNLVAYGDTLNQPYRAARVKSQREVSWSEAWKLAKGGKALFDLERERKVDEFYDPEVSKISKQLAIGRTIGEIIATLETPQDYVAFERMLRGEDAEDFKNAIKDYDTAKISPGRDIFYETFDIDPGEFGANRKAFNLTSGTVDLASLIFLDPLTYIPFAGASYKAATLSLMKISDTAVGSGARLVAIEKAFDDAIFGPGVRRFYDTVGPQIKLFKEGDEVQKAQALGEISRAYKGDLTPQALDEMVKGNVFDANSAKQFFQEVNDFTNILVGREVRKTPVLPTYSSIRVAKNGLRNAVLGLSGVKTTKSSAFQSLFNKGEITATQLLDELTDIGFGAKAEELAPQIFEQFNKQRTVMDKLVRQVQIRTDLNSLKIGIQYDKDGNVIKDFGQKSADQVRGLVGMVANRQVADEFALKWYNATPGERIVLRDKLTVFMAYGLGMMNTPATREAVYKSVNAQKREVYGAPIQITREFLDNLKDTKFKEYLIKSKNITDETLDSGKQIFFDPSTIATDSSKAIGLWNLTNEISIPPIQEWAKEALKNKNYLFRALGTYTNSRVSSGLVDLWAALTLLPRLGIRSIIEEVMVYGLVGQLKDFKNLMLVGMPVSRAIRRVTAPTGTTWREIRKGTPGKAAESLSLGMRAYYKLMQPGLTKEIAEKAPNASKAQMVDLIKKSVMQGRLGKLARKDPNVSGYIDDLIQYSMFSSNFGLVRTRRSTGTRLNNLGSIGDDLINDFSAFNTEYLSFNADVKKFNAENKKGGGYGYVGKTPEKSDEYFVTLIEEIEKRVAAGGKVGEIALKYLDDDSKAVAEIAAYLMQNKGLAKQFAGLRGASDLDYNLLAQQIYWGARYPFQKGNGTINADLLAMVRKSDEKGFKFSTDDLSIERLREMSFEDLPNILVGQKYIPNPTNDAGIIDNFVKYGYDWMDRQIASLVSEPMFFSNMMNYRSTLAPLQTRKKQELVAKGLSDAAADKASREWATNVAEQMATKRTLDYVDNPLVRTNLAWTMRNFARFYRAIEDFYRRAYRITFKNEQALVRFRLSAEALDHSGFIYRNDEPTMMGEGEGERYFIFPADEIMNAAVSPITKFLTGKDFVMPLPLEFTGKVKMIAPSLDPDAAMPAFSGPISGVSMIALERLMPNFMGPIKDNLLATTLGRYSKNVSWTDAVLPSNVRRALSAFNQDDVDSQFASAARKSIAYYVANGQGLKPDTLDADGNLTIISEQQKYEFKRNIEATAMNVVITRFFLGLISPVAPQIGFGKDIPSYLKETGNVNFKAEFNKLVDEIAATGEEDVYNKALQRWTKINPGLLAYTIGETDAKRIATVKKTKEAGKWVRENRELIKDFPEGSAFFVPFAGEFGFDEYQFLKREGYIESLPIEDFLKEVVIADQAFEYRELRKQYEQKIEEQPAPSLKTYYRQEWAEVSQEYLIDKPLLVESLQTFESTQRYENAYNDLRQIILSGRAPQNSLTVKYKKMIDIYEGLNGATALLSDNTAFQRSERERLRTDAMAEIEKIAAGDAQAEAAVRVLFRRLIGV